MYKKLLIVSATLLDETQLRLTADGTSDKDLFLLPIKKMRKDCQSVLVAVSVVYTTIKLINTIIFKLHLIFRKCVDL